jgi:uncharacterized membrane protein
VLTVFKMPIARAFPFIAIGVAIAAAIVTLAVTGIVASFRAFL